MLGFLCVRGLSILSLMLRIVLCLLMFRSILSVIVILRRVRWVIVFRLRSRCVCRRMILLIGLSTRRSVGVVVVGGVMGGAFRSRAMNA